MSADSRLASLLISFHLVAITFAAVPEPLRPGPVPLDHRAAPHPVAVWIGGVLDRMASGLARAESWFRASTRPLRAVTRPYVVGLPQSWKMFAEPSLDDRYLRADYFVGSDSVSRRVVRRVEMPLLPEDRIRLLYQSRDKAINVSLGAHLRTSEEGMRPDGALPTSGATLAALVRHLHARLRSEGVLLKDEHVLRTEIRLGFAPTPAPGMRVDPDVSASRLRALERYRRGEADGVSAVPYARLNSTGTEADITWWLIHISEP
jgi:hypothetical protein